MDEKENIAWASGLYEGEGTCYVLRQGDRNLHHVKLRLKMTNPEPVFQFKEVLGVGNIYGPYPIRGRKPIWEFHTAAAKDVEIAINKLYPFLSQERKNQIEIAWEKAYGF